MCFNVPVRNEDATSYDIFSKFLGIVTKRAFQKISSRECILLHAHFMIPWFCMTTWWLNRLNDIVFAHFIITNCAQFGWFVTDYRHFDVMMWLTKWLKSVSKLKEAITFWSTRIMEWLTAKSIAAANICTNFIAESAPLICITERDNDLINRFVDFFY